MYTDQADRNSYNYLNDDSTKYFSLNIGSGSFNVIVLHPDNGSHIATKIVTPSATSFSEVHSNGRFSNNMLLIHVGQGSPSSENLIFVNTDDWTSTTYISTYNRILYNHSPMFNSDQIVLLLTDVVLDYYTLQTAYDKLHLTEFYTL